MYLHQVREATCRLCCLHRVVVPSTKTWFGVLHMFVRVRTWAAHCAQTFSMVLGMGSLTIVCPRPLVVANAVLYG